MKRNNPPAMRISRERSLKELQREFNSRFPFLKLEFYSQPHGPGQGSPEDCRLDPDHRVHDVQPVLREGHLLLDGCLPTGRFEQQLREEFGLNAQVFRLSYGNWLQTWATDAWTLDEQNRRGEIMGERGVFLG